MVENVHPFLSQQILFPIPDVWVWVEYFGNINFLKPFLKSLFLAFKDKDQISNW